MYTVIHYQVILCPSCCLLCLQPHLTTKPFHSPSRWRRLEDTQRLLKHVLLFATPEFGFTPQKLVQQRCLSILAEPQKNGTKLGKFKLIPLLRCRITILQFFWGTDLPATSFFRVICVVTFTHRESPATTPLRRRCWCPFWGGARLEGAVICYHIIISYIYLLYIYIYIIPFTSYIIHTYIIFVYIILYYTVLYHIIWYYNILYHIILYHIILYCIVLYHIILYYIISYHITLSYTHHLICHILYNSYLNMILLCSKKSISICLHLCFCLPWRSIWYLFVSSPPLMNGRNEESPIFPTALRHWTIHRHPPFEVIGPKSRLNGPQRSAVLPAVLVAWLLGWLHPLFFVERGREGKHGKIVFFCVWWRTPLPKISMEFILLEIKWKFDGGGSDGVSVWGGHWEIEERKAQFEVWKLESLFWMLRVSKRLFETLSICGYLWWWCLRT